MSASLVRKSLAVVDPQFSSNSNKKRKTELSGLISENKKILTKTYKKGGKKGAKVNCLSQEKKVTVSEARRNYKSKEQILKENLRKLELIKQASKVDIDSKIVNQIIERAVTKRPLTKPQAPEKDQKTAFTEEDFEKFKREYLNE